MLSIKCLLHSLAHNKYCVRFIRLNFVAEEGHYVEVKSTDFAVKSTDLGLHGLKF